jgi:hypothetical protein
VGCRVTVNYACLLHVLDSGLCVHPFRAYPEGTLCCGGDITSQFHMTAIVILLIVLYYKGSRDSAVGIATGYGLGDGEVGVRVPVRSRIFTSPFRPDRLWGSPNLLYSGYRGLFPGSKKRPGREADHSPPTSAEVKKMCIYTSGGSFTFYL